MSTDNAGHRAGCGCAEGEKIQQRDQFSQLIREKGELAAKVQRLEELLVSARAQSEALLTEKERLKDSLGRAACGTGGRLP